MPVEIPNVGRDDLAVLFCELGFKVGAEVGVERGVFSEMLCQRNPALHLYAIDAWTEYEDLPAGRWSQAKLDAYYAAARARLAAYDCDLVRKFSREAARDFEPESLDFVYIDANHEFRYVADDLCVWAKIVRPGGIVSGHDYMRRRSVTNGNCHVPYVVQAYAAAYSIWPWFVLGTNDIGLKRDHFRSFMWVKA